MHDRFRTISGFILKNKPMGEHDAWVTVLTPEYGKMNIIGRGALSPRSRRRTALQPLTKSTLLLERHHEYWYVREATAENTFTITDAAEKRLYFLTQIVKIIDKLIAYETTETHNTTLFQLVEEAYMMSEHGQNTQYLLHIFCGKVLAILGFFPDFKNHPRCTKNVRTVFAQIPSGTCTEIIQTNLTVEEQKTITMTIQKIYRTVVTESTSGTPPIRSMMVASSS